MTAPITPEYLEALQAAVERAGVVKVARAAGISRSTVWRALTGGEPRGLGPVVDAIDRIRDALRSIEPDAPPPPPPLVGVRDADHHGFITFADHMTPVELARLRARPSDTLRALRAAARPK